jgi:hypothetical protein
MRTGILAAIFFFASTITGQTYFYVDAITTDPATPTVLDMIDINLIGNLSNSSSSVQSTGFAVSGTEIDLLVDCTSGIGLPVLTPHTETINIGSLPAGTYHINLSGTGLGDFVSDTTDYYFTVSGTTGLPDYEQVEFTCQYHNLTNILFLSAAVNQRIEMVQIFNMQGQLVLASRGNNEQSMHVPVPDDLTGTFIVRVRTADLEWSDIFIISK